MAIITKKKMINTRSESENLRALEALCSILKCQKELAEITPQKEDFREKWARYDKEEKLAKWGVILPVGIFAISLMSLSVRDSYLAYKYRNPSFYETNNKGNIKFSSHILDDKSFFGTTYANKISAEDKKSTYFYIDYFGPKNRLNVLDEFYKVDKKTNEVEKLTRKENKKDPEWKNIKKDYNPFGTYLFISTFLIKTETVSLLNQKIVLI